MAIEVVFFDVGETLIDETAAWAQRAAEVGVTQLTLFGALGALIARGEDHRRVWGLLGVEQPAGEIQIDASDLYADVMPCLRLLRRAGYRIGLAGNQPTAAEGQLRRLGLPVDYVASSERWGVEKPAPEFFARICDEVGVASSRIAYVGDRIDNDVAPAQRAGMFAVFLRRGPWGFIHADRLGTDEADARIDSLLELPAVLERTGR